MSLKDDLQKLDIQLDIQNEKNIVPQLIEWSKQVSARMKEMQREIDKLNRWVYPK